ncbi:MAG: ribosomal L7Ae/L30e/S12e/Gadd45 family protein [Gemmatimonadetes bacterium]|nr:ribosomal L7Ae/L30e/S12e/Gadd45 family protein [Gemmatimonadota bacterium]MCH8938181.1 ribosomal L7Ae/L30e/S12e/Gadd45 family protein [Gemmatimonadota bacterium]
MVGGALGLLGLGMRAGSVVVGTAGVRAALRRGELALVMVASDRSSRTNEKVLRLAGARRVPLIVGPSADDLGRSVGRGSVQAVGVRDAELAAGIKDQTREDGR